MKQMNLASLIVAAFIITASSFASASYTMVKCWQGNLQQRYVQVKVAMNGQLTLWNSDRVAESDGTSSHFSFFDQSLEMFEDVDFFKGKNGYAIVRVITTADAMVLGVSPDLKRGFLSYEDHGSGAGDFKIELNCKPLTALY